MIMKGESGSATSNIIITIIFCCISFLKLLIWEWTALARSSNVKDLSSRTHHLCQPTACCNYYYYILQDSRRILTHIMYPRDPGCRPIPCVWILYLNLASTTACTQGVTHLLVICTMIWMVQWLLPRSVRPRSQRHTRLICTRSPVTNRNLSDNQCSSRSIQSP